ncbi:hypothetical protein [Aestuariivita boseongensis]|uniref:hypothetical protein n=1 Tax=Aestuariivita boseongensis TaxID=1470562 RepID=UPI000680FEE2|nr:hypothetical protein [Aestuariivita boseongensis]
MTDEDFVKLAIFALPDHITTTAAACLMAQIFRGERLTPREIMDVCKALGVTGSDRTPALNLLSYTFSEASRPNRHVFWDLFNLPRSVRPLIDLRDRNGLLALGVIRILIKLSPVQNYSRQLPFT